jgi:hypothetical protein
MPYIRHRIIPCLGLRSCCRKKMQRCHIVWFLCNRVRNMEHLAKET